MNKIARFASIAAVTAVLSACGAKGPLFLPEKVVPMEEMPAAADPDTSASDIPAVDASDTDASDAGTSDATAPAEPPVEAPATPPADGNG